MVKFELIKPFTPEEGINYDDMSLEVNSRWEHTDPQAETEFRRFTHRDFGLGAIYPMTSIGMTLPMVLTDVGNYAYPNYAIAIIGLALTAFEYTNHLWRENTAAVSLWRHRGQMVLVVIITVGCAIAFWHATYNTCADTFDLLRWAGLQRPEITPLRVQVFCRDTIQAPPQFWLFLLFCFNFSPLLSLAMVAFTSLCLVLARLVVPHSPESGENIAVQVLMTLTMSAISMTMLLLRYRSQLQQFQQAVQVVRENNTAMKREEDLDILLCSMLPSSALARLTLTEEVADYSPEATVLFSDMAGFTAWSSTRNAKQVTSMLNVLMSDFDIAAQVEGVEKVKTIGDAYWAFTGLPEVDPMHAHKMCKFALQMLTDLQRQNKKHPEWEFVQLRIGIHSGPLNGGILGSQQLSYEVFGPTNDLAQRAEQEGIPMRVAVTSDVLSALGVDTPPDQVEGSYNHPVVGATVVVKTLKLDSSHADDSPPVFLHCCPAAVLTRYLSENVTTTAEADQRFVSRMTSVGHLLSHSLPGTPQGSSGSRQLPTTGTPESTTATWHLPGTPQGSSGSRQLPTTGTPKSTTATRHLPGQDPQDPLGLSILGRRSSMAPTIVSGISSHSKTSHYEADVKAKRREFLQRRATAAREQEKQEKESCKESSSDIGDLAAGSSSNVSAFFGDITTEGFTEELSARRYNWMLFDFKSAHHEAEYVRFAQEKQLTFRRASRVCTLALITAVLLGTGINQAAFSTVSIALFLVSYLSGLLDCALCFLSPRFPEPSEGALVSPRLVPVLFHHISILSLFFAAGLMDSTAPGGSSVSTNDMTYLHGISSFILTIGNTGLVPAIALIAVNVFILTPCCIGLILKTVMISLGMMCFFVPLIAFGFAVMIMERSYRQQYVDTQVALHHTGLQEARQKEQQALLGSIVPGHVIKPLMAWLAVDLDPASTYVQTWHRTCVAFVRFGQTTTNNTCETVDDPLSASSNTLAGGLPGWDSTQWLCPLHQAVDRLLQKFKRVIKIKTMGDTLMLAGPFEEQEQDNIDGERRMSSEFISATPTGSSGPVQLPSPKGKYEARTLPGATLPQITSGQQRRLNLCLEQMVAAVVGISTLAPQVMAGLHIGEVVGAVLGNNRLCFDLFGDTVNVAARTMTAGSQVHEIQEQGRTEFLSVSEDFYRAYDQLDNKAGGGAGGLLTRSPTFSDTYRRKAKGKGELQLRSLHVSRSSPEPEDLNLVSRAADCEGAIPSLMPLAPAPPLQGGGGVEEEGPKEGPNPQLHQPEV